MYGKIKGNRGFRQKFSDWVQEKFPGLDTRVDVPAAIWFASVFQHDVEIPLGISHPRNIREWFNETYSNHSLPEELLEVTPEPTVSLPKRDAERVAKVALRAESNDEGAETAERHLEGLAKKHGTTKEKLVESVGNLWPSLRPIGVRLYGELFQGSGKAITGRFVAIVFTHKTTLLKSDLPKISTVLGDSQLIALTNPAIHPK